MQNNVSHSLPYREDIDGLRAVAVLSVILYHLGELEGGYVGVDLFFVISGFLICRIVVTGQADSDFSLLQFYERRVRRLLPSLFVVKAVTASTAIWIMTPFDLIDFIKSLTFTTLFAANLWFYGQAGYFSEAMELSPLQHAWSLGVEEQFYLVFPIVVLGVLRLGSIWVLFIVLSGLAMGSFLATIYFLPLDPKAAFYLPHLRAWELLLGAMLCVAVYTGVLNSAKMSSSWINVLSGLGLAAIVFPIVFYSTETPFPGVAALLPCMGGVALIAVGSDSRSISRKILAVPSMVYLGKISYSLYLWHWPLIWFFFYQNGALNLTTRIMVIVLSIGISSLSFFWLERPIRNRQLFGSVAVFSGSMVFAAVFFATSAVIWWSDGLAFRMDSELLAMANPRTMLHDRSDCHLVSANRLRNGEICLRGDDQAEPTFVLVGDSHANAYSPAIFAAAKKQGLAGYQITDSGFLPLLGVQRRGKRSKERSTAMLEFLDKNPTVRTIIITRFWEHQMTGSSYRHGGAVWVDEDYDDTGAAYNATATHNGLSRLAQRLPHHQIIMLDDVPSGDDLHFRSQLRRLRVLNRSALGLPSSDYQTQRDSYERVLQSIAATNSNIEYRPIFGALCNEAICPLFRGDILMFRDGDHLSWKGALLLTEPTEKLLSEIFSD